MKGGVPAVPGAEVALKSPRMGWEMRERIREGGEYGEELCGEDQ